MPKCIDTPALRPDDWLLEWQTEEDSGHNLNIPHEPQPGPSTDTDVAPAEPTVFDKNMDDLDTEILEILGDDPNSKDKYGPEIRNELANRLLHIVKDGLTKEIRKNLITKYLLPNNCVQLDAPKMNLEIKAAIADTAVKRDKGIENKQKQMSSAIACLADIINSQLNSKPINNDMLQKLMDISRMLCDIQHADSITRRNFILFALKNDMKEHLKNTKIDTFLFGENLTDTLKSAKALNKSGIELKAESSNRTANTNYKRLASRDFLNCKAPPQARRPPAGPA
ncbi:jg26660, partial [Pararge aegeria aegeria]